MTRSQSQARALEANSEARDIVNARGARDTVLVLMGVSGCGKTAVALQLQRILGWKFQEGDDLHPPANVEKMRLGIPLSDADRLPWLERVARWIDERLAAGEPGIITCSNLKRAYREVTIGQRKGVTLVFLRAAEPVIAARLARRKHRYMPASLLHSQFQTLEVPAADEHPVVVAVDGTLKSAVIDLLGKIAVSVP